MIDSSNSSISFDQYPGDHRKKGRVALVQRFVPHYNLAFYRKLLQLSKYDWEFIYGERPGGGESGLIVEAEKFLPTRPIRNVPIGSAVWQKGVARWLYRGKYDAVVFELGWQIVSNPLLVAAAHRVGTVVIPWTKGIAENGQRRPRWRRLMEKSFTRRFDAILAYGRVSARYFQAYGFPAEKIFVAQNTLDVRRIVEGVPKDRARAGELRRSLNIKADDLVIGYLGRLVIQKRVDQIIAAFAKSFADKLDVRLIIAGDGPDRGSLEEFAKTHDVVTRMIFVGRVPEEDVGGYFQIFDVVVSAYSAGLAILEAMAHGKINVIAPETRPETELIENNVTGIVTEDFSTASLGDGLLRAYASARSGNQLGQAAQASVLINATTEKMVEAFDSAIGCALSSSVYQ